MNEILPGVHHWITRHEGIGQPVHSYLLADEAVLIDPRVPDEGVAKIREIVIPAAALLTNRHHYRHSDRFREAFQLSIRCHEAGMHEFGPGEEVEPFAFGDTLAGRVEALELDAICPEETAFLIPREGGILALGDAVIRWGDELGFVPDEYIGDDPERVKRSIREAVRGLLEHDFRHLLLAHGEPIVDEARERLEAFSEAESK